MAGITQWAIQWLYEHSKPMRQAMERVDSVSISPLDRINYAKRMAEEVEKKMAADLETAYPKYGYTTQFAEMEKDPKDEGAYLWRIQGLVGLEHFAHAAPGFTMIITVFSDNKVVHAWVYDVMHDELFDARPGQGLYMNKRRLRVSPHDDLDVVRLGIAVRQPSDLPPARWAHLMTCAPHPRWQMSGSPWLDLLAVAAGRLDIGVACLHEAHEGLLLCLQESGAQVHHVEHPHGRELWAANPRLLRQLLPKSLL